MEEFAGPARRAAGPVAHLDQADRQPAGDRVERAAGADHAAANHDDIEFGAARHRGDSRLAGQWGQVTGLHGSPFILYGAAADARPRGLQPTSTQSRVRWTAIFHLRYPSTRCSGVQVGCQRRDSFQLSRSSSVSRQKPTASPAAYVAPSAVVSATTGRLTGTPRMSACNCMHRLLAVTPPSTLSTSSVTPESCCIASTTSRVW